MTRSRTRGEFAEADKSMPSEMDRSDKNNDRMFNMENNAARARFTENNDSRVHCAVSIAQINPDAEQSKTKLTEEDRDTIEIVSNTCVRIKAECMRVGSYKYNEEQTSVIVSTEGLNFDLPKIHGSKYNYFYVFFSKISFNEFFFLFYNFFANIFQYS